ncbi:MAG TPA: diguanylate cyclase [Ilumatobacteraceae bacterium]
MSLDLDEPAIGTELTATPADAVTSQGRIVVAEDSLVVRSILCGQLEDEGYEVIEAADGFGALAECEDAHPDAILLDIEMPGLDGHQVLARLKADPALSDIPVVFLTGRTSTADMVAGLRAGAHDYLKKPFEPAELIARISGAVRIKRLQDELRMRNEELDRLSRVDPLTGIFNRRHIDEQLERQASSALRHRQSLAVLMLDIDHFKRINDSEGHPGGDIVIREIAVRLSRVLRAEDFVGRWGGEEFVVLAPQTDLGGAQALAERARHAIATPPFTVHGHEIDVTVSVGCAAGLEVGSALVKRADDAMYRSKADGRNRVSLG